METGTKITQKKFGTQFIFSFGEDKLTRNHSDNTGENEFSLFYEAIDTENPTLFAVNRIRKYARYYLLAVLLSLPFIVFIKDDPKAKMICSVVFLASVVVLLVANYLKLFTIKYTVFNFASPERKGAIRVIHDNNHDLIVKEISARRLARLRKIYATVNLNVDPVKELQKFQWLKDHSVINELEYREAVEKIKASQDLSSSTGVAPVEKKEYLN